MYKILIYICFIFSVVSQTFADTFVTATPSAEKFPLIEMPFYVMNNENIIYQDYKVSDFYITENGNSISQSKIYIECTETQAPVQVLLMVDISNSMNEIVEGKAKIEWVLNSMKEFIKSIDLSEFSAIGISTFCSGTQKICDFTNNKDTLLNAINRINSVEAATDFNAAFFEVPNGIYPRLSKRPNFNRIVIFLSDGVHSASRGPFEQLEAKNKLVSSQIKLYAITITSETDQSLTNLNYVAKETKGAIYSGRSASTLPDLYREIALNITKRNNCKLFWESDLYCDKTPRVTNVQVKYKPLNQTAKYTYTAPEWSVFNILKDNSSYIFGNPAPGETVYSEVKISPNPFNMKINKISLSDESFFKIVDWGDGTGLEKTNFIVPAGSWLSIKVKFTQLDSYLPRKAFLNINALPCSEQIPLYGGDIKIILEKPIASDIFTTCEEVNIVWSGTTEKAKKELYYRYNKEKWNLIAKDITGFSYLWMPEKRDGKCQIKVIAYPFLNSSETISDTSEYFTVIKPELTVQNENLTLDTTLIGFSSKKIFSEVLKNNKSEPVTINNWKIKGKAFEEFNLIYLEKYTLSEGETTALEIEFTPTLDGPRNAVLVLYPECGDSVEINLNAYGYCNTLALDTIDFGNRIIDTIADSTVYQVFYNPMNKITSITPYLSGMNRNQFELIGYSGTEVIQIPPFGSFDIPIRFKPTSYGQKQAILNISVTGCKNKAVALTGFAHYIGITVNDLDFGRKRFKTKYDTLYLNISNKDRYPKNVSNIVLDSFAQDYKILGNNFPIKILENENKKIPVVFNPQTIDTFNTFAKIYTLENDTLTSYFKGMNYLPELKIKSDCPAALNVGESGIAKIYLYNPSKTEKLKIGICNILDNVQEFSWLGAQPQSLEIPVNDSLVLEVGYQPVLNGKHQCNFEVYADNYDATYKLNWQVNKSSIICDAMNIDVVNPEFKSMLLCNNEISNVKIKNLAHNLILDLYLDKATISGIDENSFELLENTTISLDGGTSRDIPIKFTALHSGTHQAVLNIPNSAEIPITIELIAEVKALNQYADPSYIRYIPGERKTIIFGINTPLIEQENITSLKLKLKWNSDVLNVSNNSYKQLISSNQSDTEYLTTDSIRHFDGQTELYFSGILKANKKYDLFSFNYLTLLDVTDSSSIVCDIIYECQKSSKVVTLFERGDYCFEDGRNIIIKNNSIFLKGPYPNPATNEINVEYFLAEDAEVIIQIFDINGKKITDLIDKRMKRGNYSNTFNIKELSGGIYTLKFSVANIQLSRQFVVE